MKRNADALAVSWKIRALSNTGWLAVVRARSFLHAPWRRWAWAPERLSATNSRARPYRCRTDAAPNRRV